MNDRDMLVRCRVQFADKRYITGENARWLMSKVREQVDREPDVRTMADDIPEPPEDSQ